MAKRVRIYNPSSGGDNDTFFNDVVETLSEPLKRIPGKYAHGGGSVDLWFEMLADPNYYLCESEKEILSTKFKEILEAIGIPEFNLIDLGAGDGKKTKILLDGALQMGLKPNYIGVDISEGFNDVLEK